MTTEQGQPQEDVVIDAADNEPELGNSPDLATEIVRLQEELGRAREDVLRAAADAQNTRRRAEQDIEKAHKFGQEKIVQDMVVVADNLERALASVEGGDEQFKAVTEGLELTLKSLVEGLKRHQVAQIDPRGEPFDPQYHQAVTLVPNPEVEPNTVLDVLQKGYTLHGRLVRPAMVVVSKTP